MTEQEQKNQTTSKTTFMMINDQYGGYLNFSEEAKKLFKERCTEKQKFDRCDPIMIKIVQEIGEERASSDRL
jgi:hypothetical protein